MREPRRAPEAYACDSRAPTRPVRVRATRTSNPARTDWAAQSACYRSTLNKYARAPSPDSPSGARAHSRRGANKTATSEVWDVALVRREVQSRRGCRDTSCRPARRALPELRQHLLELRNLGHDGVDSWISCVRCIARLRRLTLRLVMPSAPFDEHSAHSH